MLGRSADMIFTPEDRAAAATKRSAWLIWRPNAGDLSEQHPEFLGLYPSMETAERDIALLQEKTGTEWYALCVPFVGWGIHKWDAEMPSRAGRTIATSYANQSTFTAESRGDHAEMSDLQSPVWSRPSSLVGLPIL
jgi:hypothetical protein